MWGGPEHPSTASPEVLAALRAVAPMKKFVTLASLVAFLAVGVALTGCEENTEVIIEDPAMEEPMPEPMPEPPPMPEPVPVPADTVYMDVDTTATL